MRTMTNDWFADFVVVLFADWLEFDGRVLYNDSIMEVMNNRAFENNADSDDKDNQREFRRTFGQKVVEVFATEPTSASVKESKKKQKEYVKNIQEERALLETLNSEQRYYQDYLFYKSIENNPEGSRFIQSIPGLDMSKPLVEQLLERNKDGSRKISDETVGNILEFYQTVLKKEESIFAEKIEEIQSKYELNLKSKVESGELPQVLYENFRTAKEKNNGSIIAIAKLFDLRPEIENEEEQFTPPSTAAYIEHRGINNKGEMVDAEDTRKIMYKKFFLDQQQKNTLGSLENMVGHELTHVIAGREASFNLLPSKTGSAGIPSRKMDGEGQITMAFREGMTEAIGQMIVDSSVDADEHDLLYYLTNGKGTYLAEREFLAKLIFIDERCKGENQYDSSRKSLGKLYLEAYAETEKNEQVDSLRERLYHILNNWEDIVEDGDFPDTMLEIFRGSLSDWQDVFSICLGEMQEAIYYRQVRGDG